MYKYNYSLITRFMGQIQGTSGADRTQVGPMFAPSAFVGSWLVSTLSLVMSYLVHMVQLLNLAKSTSLNTALFICLKGDCVYVFHWINNLLFSLQVSDTLLYRSVGHLYLFTTLPLIEILCDVIMNLMVCIQKFIKYLTQVLWKNTNTKIPYNLETNLEIKFTCLTPSLSCLRVLSNGISGDLRYCLYSLTHWGWDKMAAIFQTTFSNAFSWRKIYELWLRFHWSLFLRVQLTIFKHWFR